MYFAYKYEQSKVVEVLLKYKADIVILNGSMSEHFLIAFDDLVQLGRDEFHLSGFKKILSKNLMKILSSPISLRSQYSNDWGLSPLHLLCLYDEPDLKLLKNYSISYRHEVNQTLVIPQSYKYHKCTPMHLAMLVQQSRRASVMVSAGADPKIVNRVGDTPIEFGFIPE
ncbi:hypothetical protein QAD02_018931 [Eretmocerus hayati]|uniref:Uncharacterized protein n=1 Tax=Eretmocerus hayati TaxID=131215 RepID=A0ACC2PHU1_9HYME|nr:hypothetical protein QAD02_018931 [Eretmocerus hayati]